MMKIADSPYAQAMGLGVERDAEGRIVLTMDYGQDKQGRPGFLHGGAIAGMLEVAAYATVADTLGEEDRPGIKPINITVTYMRGGRDRLTRARATIERLGRRIVNVEVMAWQDDEATPIALAQINLMLVRG